MSAIYTYGQWIDIVDRGTSGDQVMDILASWKVDAYKLLEDNHKLESRIAELEAENTALKQHPQPIEFWSDEKKELYRRNENRTIKSGREEERER